MTKTLRVTFLQYHLVASCGCSLMDNTHLNVVLCRSYGKSLLHAALPPGCCDRLIYLERSNTRLVWRRQHGAFLQRLFIMDSSLSVPHFSSALKSLVQVFELFCSMKWAVFLTCELLWHKLIETLCSFSRIDKGWLYECAFGNLVLCLSNTLSLNCVRNSCSGQRFMLFYE